MSEDEEEEVYEIKKLKKPKTEIKKLKRARRNKKLYVNLEATHYPIISEIFEEMGWIETESEYKCTMIWCDVGGSAEICAHLCPWQFYNHFQAVWSIARKVELLRNYEKMQSRLPEIYTFHPKSFLLPGQFSALKQYMLSQEKTTTFIVKPDRGAQGRGIFLIQDPEQAGKYVDMAVVQQYIPPYLIDGYKFDLRLYVLITGVNPLRLYFHNEGMARFCTEKYVEPTGSNLNKVYGHLTNYSLNKKNDHFEKNKDANDATKGSKRSYSFVLETIKKSGGNVDELQRKIDRIIRLTIGSIQPLLENQYKATVSVTDDKCRCFEILGFDILIDNELNPWLIEVNNMPSLSCDSPFDKVLKKSVVKGALEILDIQPGFKKIVNDEEKAVTQMRITGSTNLPRFNIFDPKKESEIAKKTNWRKIYPLENDKEETEIMEKALSVAKTSPLCGPIETATTKARKQKINKDVQERKQNALIPEKKKKIVRVKSEKPKIPRPFASELQKKPLIYKAHHPLNKLNPTTSLFKSMKGNDILQNEERERLISIKRQSLNDQSIGLLNSILEMLGSAVSTQNTDDKQQVVQKKPQIQQQQQQIYQKYKVSSKMPRANPPPNKISISTINIGQQFMGFNPKK